MCGEQTVDRSTVSCRATRFHDGHTRINNDPRPERLKTPTDEQSVKLVVGLSSEDRGMTCEEISQATRIQPTSVFRNLHERKICSLWVPHCLTVEQKQKDLDVATSVSYTHLDVYKRQYHFRGLYFSFLFFGCCP